MIIWATIDFLEKRGSCPPEGEYVEGVYASREEAELHGEAFGPFTIPAAKVTLAYLQGKNGGVRLVLERPDGQTIAITPGEEVYRFLQGEPSKGGAE